MGDSTVPPPLASTHVFLQALLIKMKCTWLQKQEPSVKLMAVKMGILERHFQFIGLSV